MIIDLIYTFLCSFYGVAPNNIPSKYLLRKPIKISDFKIGDKNEREAVFAIKNSNEDWFIGIYINPEIILRVESGNFNKDDIACVVEGVSHFIYLANKINHEEKTSILELELQAEIDKFIFLCATGNFQPRQVKDSFDCIFKNFKFSEDLNECSLEVYEKANYFAKKYCYNLFKQFLRNHHETAKNNIIKFYHEPLKNKLLEIQT